ncbi:hypothetical protein AVEN_73392-1 [Araneus ventricosus]|uniref:DUF4371 domain-containing protein n=1 Tax=Araneus ventricosus TaxID=182803 RepID=A0A4Y2PA42_ARAVE|nr:hypothetical protein AVEN_73392-1 [Araneus ventricosus]
MKCSATYVILLDTFCFQGIRLRTWNPLALRPTPPPPSALMKENAIAVVIYKITHLLEKKGKLFSDVEIINEYNVEAVSCLDPKKVDKYKQLPLSRRTTTDRQQELVQNLTDQLHTIIKNEHVYFSIGLDESTNKMNSAQALYFICAKTKDFQRYEELLAFYLSKELVALAFTTT